MKNLISSLLIVFLITFSTSALATDYYSIKSGNAADLSSWNTSRSGDGSVSTSFDDPNDNFIIQNGSSLTGTAMFKCSGSMIIETGGTYTTGTSGNITNIATVVTINQGGVLKLSANTTLIAGFMLIQGTLQNLGGEIRFNNSPVAASNGRNHQ